MKANKNEEIIKMPLDPEEEKVFHVGEKTKYQFSQVITRYLVKNNLTEEEIANQLGLDKNATAKLLRGYTENFSLDNNDMKNKEQERSKKSIAAEVIYSEKSNKLFNHIREIKKKITDLTTLGINKETKRKEINSSELLEFISKFSDEMDYIIEELMRQDIRIATATEAERQRLEEVNKEIENRVNINFKISKNNPEQAIKHLAEKLKKVELILKYPHSLLNRITEIGIEKNSLEKYKEIIEKKLAKSGINKAVAEERSKISLLNISNQNLEGSLDLSDFTNLQELNCSHNQLTSDQRRHEEKIYNRFHGSLEPLQSLVNLKFLDINNTDIDSGTEYLPKSIEEIHYSSGGELKSKVKEIFGQSKNFSYIGSSSSYVATNDAQQFLNERYQKEDKSKITEININYKQSESPLNLSDFPNLENLKFYGNNLTTLNISNCPKLKTVQCSNNSNLTGLSITNCPEIAVLKCNSNNLTSLDFLVGLTSEKLKLLDLSSNYDEDKIKKGIYNHFVGSLEPLEKLPELEYLFINDTDIDSGWEYLPDSVNEFICSVEERPQARVKVIQEELRKIGEPKNNNFANQKQVIRELEARLEEARKKSDAGEEEKLKETLADLKQKLTQVEQTKLEAERQLEETVQQLAKTEEQLKKTREKLTENKIELEIQQSATKKLQERLEKAIESEEKESKPEAKQKLEKEVKNLRKKLEEAKQKEIDLNTKLAVTEAVLNRAENEVNYSREQLTKPTPTNTITISNLGSLSGDIGTSNLNTGSGTLEANRNENSTQQSSTETKNSCQKIVDGLSEAYQGVTEFVAQVQQVLINPLPYNLYQLIYELKEKKGRKLKIMCDWDEVLKSREATVYHIIANRSSPFAEFFQRFWEKVSVEYQGHSCRIISTNLKEVEELREKNPEEFQKRAKEISRTDPIKALKENLIEHLIITGNYKKNRSVKIANSDDIPDDNPNNILGTRTLFSYETNKVYMLPDYKTNQNVQGEHIFRVPVFQMREIANIINPDTDFEFAHLKREIEKLKIISQIRIKELELKKLASFMENELKDDKKAQENLKLFLQGKIKALKKEVFTMDFRARILEDKLINIGGLQTILDKQKEISCLEEQLCKVMLSSKPLLRTSNELIQVVKEKGAELKFSELEDEQQILNSKLFFEDTLVFNNGNKLVNEQ
ncbi:39490_t:CDS:10 [Gigaspora margarita]|uniref:39490_t:CDS:1 n=1 Tax=Gigaspora margarita TaxID=4874 RepID=A0ABM8VWE6_GIGMA|nr:39490_t:CDS:10 [Gigaspora margarita]